MSLPHRKLLAVLLVGCLAAVGGVAVAEEPKPPLSPIDKELETIRKMLFNAATKVRKGVVDIGAAGTSDKALTRARACCSGNLEHIAASMDQLRKLVRDRTTCFEGRRDLAGVETANFTVRSMRIMDSSLTLFEEAESPMDVQGGLDSCTRSYLQMKDALDALPSCGTAQSD